jgi:hypothetical protein
MQTNKTRAIENYQRQLDQSLQQTNWQIEDLERNLAQNIL